MNSITPLVVIAALIVPMFSVIPVYADKVKEYWAEDEDGNFVGAIGSNKNFKESYGTNAKQTCQNIVDDNFDGTQKCSKKDSPFD
jgi:hypothetical protein